MIWLLAEAEAPEADGPRLPDLRVQAVGPARHRVQQARQVEGRPDVLGRGKGRH